MVRVNDQAISSLVVDFMDARLNPPLTHCGSDSHGPTILVEVSIFIPI